jgi:hypothetical protein
MIDCKLSESTLIASRRDELGHMIVSWNRAFAGNGWMFIDLVIGSRPKVCELVEDKRNTSRLQNRVPLRYLKMQVWTSRVTAVAEAPQNVSAPYIVIRKAYMVIRKKTTSVGKNRVVDDKRIRSSPLNFRFGLGP